MVGMITTTLDQELQVEEDGELQHQYDNTTLTTIIILLIY